MTRQTLSALKRGMVGRITLASIISIIEALDYELDIKEKIPTFFSIPP